MKKKNLILVSLLLIASMILTACGGSKTPATNTPVESGDILIGGNFEVTGELASFGTSTRNGIQLAFDEINANGGVLGGKNLKFIVEDNKSSSTDAAIIAQKLIQNDKVVALLGPVTSTNSLAAAPIAVDNKIPMISPTATNPAVTKVGEYIFRASFIDPFQGAVMANFALDNLNAKTAAIMIDSSSDYSKGLGEVFKSVFTSGGGQIVSEQFFVKDDTDFNTILTSVKSQNPEVVFVPAYYGTVGPILDQAKYNVGFSENIIFLGADGWDSPELFDLAKDAANGFYFSNHYSPDIDTPEVKNFTAAYQAKFNAVPDALAALGYDAAYMLAAAIENAGSADPTVIRDSLAAIEITGISGKIKLDENRDPVKSAVVIKIEDQKQVYYTTVDPK
ncbi:ABC transporter substrate-binding protein [Serpentinicella alkaliphila]|uniref:Amino acid/amide ABC transporter substrate-binding protein (HAAT family) n=1 Tax=Serpentinicella alkaliphila TaxID=1734049 RepID=A0A4R2TNQ8_9FIRM|nr:ABC transporter substrate-binding protein [Serpentinicella alkaliphila]QUH26629.1 ABC transporter substrate-binding protein [Serpentinicella alkaliphila]TCQ02905.1 amino acid/amide ABC transporter substrate-binding protein (HAAT family) [Serpentinicella alkaliphila]